MSESVLATVFAALDIAVFLRGPDDTLRLLSEPPEWFSRLEEGVDREHTSGPQGRSPVLDDFIGVAAQFWSSNGNGRLKSVPWTELDAAGNQYLLEASAVCVGTAHILTIEWIEAEGAERRGLQQKANELTLAQERLTRAFRDTLVQVRSIAYDMKDPLAAISNFHASIDRGGLDPKHRQLLEISKRQIPKLEGLVQELQTKIDEV